MIKKHLKTWGKLIKTQLAHDMTHPNQFFLHIIASAIFVIAGPILGLVIYGTSKGFPGWDFNQFILLYGSFSIFAGIAGTVFIAMVWRVLPLIQRGEFDKFLLRPLSTSAFMIMQGWDFDGLGRLATGIILVLYAGVSMNLSLNTYSVLSYFFIMSFSILFLIGEMLLVVGLAFKFVKTHSIMEVFHILFEFGKFPMTIYSRPLKFGLSFIIPVGIAAFYPASALMGWIKIGEIIGLGIACTVFLFIGYGVFKWGIKHYTSAGG
jgi:ABC-2 type transport system permease protein